MTFLLVFFAGNSCALGCSQWLEDKSLAWRFRIFFLVSVLPVLRSFSPSLDVVPK